MPMTTQENEQKVFELVLFTGATLSWILAGFLALTVEPAFALYVIMLIIFPFIWIVQVVELVYYVITGQAK